MIGATGKQHEHANRSHPSTSSLTIQCPAKKSTAAMVSDECWERVTRQRQRQAARNSAYGSTIGRVLESNLA